MTGTRIVAIVPARGGSKGIPLKNLTVVAGLPLVSWTIRQLRAAGIEEIFVSSDSDEIGAVAVDEGSSWIRRPESIAGDQASSESAILHAASTLGLKDTDVIVFAQATSPLRLPMHFAESLAMFDRQDIDSLFSGVRMDDLCLWTGLTQPAPSNYSASTRRRRQDSPPQVVENGSLYVFRAGRFVNARTRLHGRVGCYLMPRWTIHEIDEPEDIGVCEVLLRAYVVDSLLGA